MRKRVYTFFALLMVLLAASCYSIVHVSTGSEYVDAAGRQSIYELDVAQSRGCIYDCKLEPLTGTQRRLLAAVAPTIESIGTLETATEGKYRERLAVALESGKPFVMEVPEMLEGSCIDVFNVPRRYADDQLAPHVIGYTDSLGGGVSGVEKAMNDVLEQSTGEVKVYYRVDAIGRVIAGEDRGVTNTLSESRAGVALTLDTAIQRLAEEAAADLGKGAVVVTEVPNCEVRALVSMPQYSPNDVGAAAEDEDAPLINRAFSAYSPGSIFKLVTAAVEIENRADGYQTNCTGSVNVDGMEFRCIDGTAHGQVNLKTAVEKSCNCYFISAARALGAQPVLSMAYNLGFGVQQEFGRGWFSEAGNLPPASELTNLRALANFSFGQGELTVTPVQAAAMMNCIASGGQYSPPRLIAGTVDSSLNLTPHEPLTGGTVSAMQRTTASRLQTYLESAVTQGTAITGKTDSAKTGAKTGTAQTGVFQGQDELLHFWYCGYVCDSSGPKYCITVLKEYSTSDDGVTGEVFRRIAEGLAELGLTE